jgi:hypothetical protein
MIGWDNFIWFAATAALCWIAGATLSFKDRNGIKTTVISLIGTAVFFSFIICLWNTLERPPMKTQGET